jgi:hypothetical protein
VNTHVSSKTRAVPEALAAHWALGRLLSCVGSLVLDQVQALVRTVPRAVTPVRLYLHADPLVSDEI